MPQGAAKKIIMLIISEFLWLRNSGMAKVGPFLYGLSQAAFKVSSGAAGISKHILGHVSGGGPSKFTDMVVGRIRSITGYGPEAHSQFLAM